jgi:RNA polymerase sigma factor (sigma-70 family)
MNELSETDLVKRYLQGDAAAFDQLYSRFRLPVFNYILRHVREHALSEDIFQDVWMRVLRSLASFRPDTNFSGWLYSIAHNRMVDYWRQQSRREEDELPEQFPQADQQSSGIRQFIRDCVERLQSLIGMLNAEQRDAFLLQQEAGLSLEQIASVTESSRETVKSRLRYALKNLRQGLEDCEESVGERDE